MKKIVFNEVTWYSKLAAIIVFVGLIPALMFYIGKEYGEVTALADIPAYVAVDQPIVTAHTVSPIPASVPASSENLKFFSTLVPPGDSSIQYSNITGYFAHGSFFFYIPQWIPDHWKMTDLPNGGMKFSPQTLQPVDFSDITITVATTTETHNAETLYSVEFPAAKKGACISGSRCEVPEADVSIVTSEILVGAVGDTRIYHIARMVPYGQIQDTFYIDGKGLTATIYFSASKENYNLYEAKVKDFVQGIGKGGAARG